VDGTSAVAAAGVMDGHAAMAALGGAAPAAAVAAARELKVDDGPLSASGISGMPAAALPYAGQQQPWQGCDAAAVGHHVAVHAAPTMLAQQQLQPQQQLQQQLSMPYVGKSVAPLGVHMLPPGFAGAHGMPAVVPGPPPGYGAPAAAPAGMPPANFRMPPGFSHNSVTQQLPSGYTGAGYGAVPGMPPEFGSSAMVRPAPGFQGEAGAAVGPSDWATVPSAATAAVMAPPGWAAGNALAGVVAAQPGGRASTAGHAAVPGIGSSVENDEDLEEMLGLLGV
jgi:hypothetical protein